MYRCHFYYVVMLLYVTRYDDLYVIICMYGNLLNKEKKHTIYKTERLLHYIG